MNASSNLKKVYNLGPFASTTLPTPYSWVNSNTKAKQLKGPLSGKSIAIKENISFKESPTSCSSAILKDYKPPFNATCVDTLIQSGAHIIGQTKMDEFGMGSQSTHLPSYYTPVHNPSCPENGDEPRSAGGSSGGSAAAVAEGSCWAALGTDTGGSVRLPASYCGVVGLKPSYGMISRRGVVSYADSLDCVGVMAREVESVRRVFDAISHPDEHDMTCATFSARQKAKNLVSSYLSSFSFPSRLSGLRIGIPRETVLPAPYLSVSPSLITVFESLGATIHHVSMPSMKIALPAYYVLASAEASSNLARYGGGWYGNEDERKQGKRGFASEQERRIQVRSEGFGREVKKRILSGTYALSADEFNNTYLKALYLRHSLRKDYQSILRTPHPLSTSPSACIPSHDGVDLILHPTSIRTAPPISSTEKDDTDETEYTQDLLTIPASLTGLPTMSVPVGEGEDGWPVGISLTAQWGYEDLLFQVGKSIEGRS
ncbi:aspartyl/glutamyl-tRNA(Asn/Gln) amidotransferase, A subunit [Cryptococcus depauperatus]|nr:aspartyl/glutamyl-tRNA(Asn/Gln) amidotransferase, A subunit [Cryptococcus depauperatus CBS 7855]